MANNGDSASLLAEDWPEVRSGPLVAGGILVAIGTVVAMVGVAVAGAHVLSATRSWMKELETPPDQIARLKWEQAKAAASAGAASWHSHPNAKVHLHRASAGSR